MTKRKKLFEQAMRTMFKGDIEEVLDKKISPFGSGSHIVLSIRHKGKKAKVIIYK